jgi:hypothetical protein
MFPCPLPAAAEEVPSAKVTALIFLPEAEVRPDSDPESAPLPSGTSGAGGTADSTSISDFENSQIWSTLRYKMAVVRQADARQTKRSGSTGEVWPKWGQWGQSWTL